MIILGVDGSLSCTGVAVLDVGSPGRETLIGTGTIRTKPTDGDDVDRYIRIARAVVALARKHRADLVALEMPYVDPAKSNDVALRLAGLDAVIRVFCRLAGIEVVTVAASSRTKALGVKGRHVERKELKARARAQVASRYSVDVRTDDEADAVGVALAGYAKWRRGPEPEQLQLAVRAGNKRSSNRSQ